MKGFSAFRGGSSKWITQTLLLSIAPVILFGTIIYHMGSWIVQEEIHRASQESLGQVRHQIETQIQTIEQMTNQIAMQSSIIALMDTGEAPSLGSLFQSNETRGDLSTMKNATDTVHSIYFYHLPQRVVITNDVVTSIDEARVFRDVSWLAEMEEMIAARQQRKWIAPRTMTSASGIESSTLTHVRILPLFYSQPKAAIAINMNPDFLDRAISRFPLGGDGMLLIVNERGELMARTSGGGEEVRVDAILEDMRSLREANRTHTAKIGDRFVSTVKSGDNGWTYAMIVSANEPRQQVEFFRKIIVLVTLALCLLGAYSAYFSHSRFQVATRTILEKLSIAKSTDAGHAVDPIARIESRITSLLKEVKQRRSLEEAHLPLLRTHYLHSLIHGNAVDISKLSDKIEEWGMFPYDTFSVMAVQMDPGAGSSFAGDEALFLFAVSNIAGELPKLPEAETYRFESIITHQHAVFILNYNEHDDSVSERELVAIADRLRSIVKKILKHTITIGIGSSVASMHDIVYSYREALQALRMNWVNVSDEVLPYSNATLVAEKLAQYPSADEQELLGALRSRDREAAYRSLEAFRSKLERDLASFHMVKTFYLQLVVAVVRLAQEYDEDMSRVFQGGNPYEKFLAMESVPQIHDWFAERLLEPILSFMESVKRRKTDLLIKQTVELIRAKYKTDLSLQVAADEVGISPSYLSQLFKDELGETFIEYVTRFRVEQAKRLLLSTDLTLQRIAEEIGYTSVQQLFRVFKKKLGMTPGEYREKRGRSSATE